MKIFLRYVLIIAALILLYELNSGTLISDIKALFNVDRDPNDLINELGTVDFTIDTVPKEYKGILNIKNSGNKFPDSSNLHVDGIMADSLRSPILFLDYKKQFYIQVYKMSASYNLSLTNALQENFVNLDIKNPGWYYLNDQSAVDYKYKYLFLKPDSMFLNIYGNQNKILLKTDSIAYYYSNFKSFAIRYRQSRKSNISGDSKDEGFFAGTNNYHPIELLFIKRGHSLYFLSMAALNIDKQPKFQPGLLYSLIKNNADNH